MVVNGQNVDRSGKTRKIELTSESNLAAAHHGCLFLSSSLGVPCEFGIAVSANPTTLVLSHESSGCVRGELIIIDSTIGTSYTLTILHLSSHHFESVNGSPRKYKNTNCQIAVQMDPSSCGSYQNIQFSSISSPLKRSAFSNIAVRWAWDFCPICCSSVTFCMADLAKAGRKLLLLRRRLDNSL